MITELGLRTTRLRDYLGQTVVIPNRTVALVSNYRRGALKTVIDVAAQYPEQAVAWPPSSRRSAANWPGSSRGRSSSHPTPTVVSLQTGEHFVRVVLDLRPPQQALVDNQVVPRLRGLLAARRLEIPNNRVAVFDRAPEPVPVSRGKDRGWLLPPN